jgi:hypothetical protein
MPLLLPGGEKSWRGRQRELARGAKRAGAGGEESGRDWQFLPALAVFTKLQTGSFYLQGRMRWRILFAFNRIGFGPPLARISAPGPDE